MKKMKQVSESDMDCVGFNPGRHRRMEGEMKKRWSAKKVVNRYELHDVRMSLHQG